MLWVIGVSIVIEFVLSTFLVNKYGRYGLLEDVSAISFIGLIFLFLVIFILSARLCKCPECKKWLTKQSKYSEGETRKYICKHCAVVWDSSVKQGKFNSGD